MPPKRATVAATAAWHRGFVADVARSGSSALPPACLDFAPRPCGSCPASLGLRLGRLRGDRDVGAVARRAQRDQPNAARCAGDEQHILPCSERLSHLLRNAAAPTTTSLRTRSAQCRAPPLPGPFALADTASTDSVNVRCSFGFIAPTPMSLRAISSPRSLQNRHDDGVFPRFAVGGMPDAAFDAQRRERGAPGAHRRRHRSAGNAGRPDTPLRFRGWSPGSADIRGSPQGCPGARCS